MRRLFARAAAALALVGLSFATRRASASPALVVESARLVFTCTDDRGAARCRFEATYRIRNQGSAVVLATDAFETRAPDAPDATRDAPMAAAPIAPGERRDVTLTGELRASVNRYDPPMPGYAVSAITARHVLLGTHERWSLVLAYDDVVAPARAWAPGAWVDVSVRSPSAWRVTAPPLEGAPWTTATSSDGVTLSSARVDARTATKLALRFEVPGTRFSRGGPLVGAGPRLDRSELRARIGYEIAGPRTWLIHSLAAETSFAGRFTIVPAMEVASPNTNVVVPSVGVGVGVPLQLRSGAEPQVGVRAQLSITFPILTLFFPFDLYPESSGADRFQAALVGQASF